MMMNNVDIQWLFFLSIFNGSFYLVFFTHFIFQWLKYFRHMRDLVFLSIFHSKWNSLNASIIEYRANI